MRKFLSISVLGFLPFSLLSAAESEGIEKPGLRTIQLVTDRDGIRPGEPFTVGLFLQHQPGFHTYWKAPGIVGVPTSLAWDLPEGFSADTIQWPAPQRTRMAEYTAYGYEEDVCLLTEITVPETVEGENVVLRARVSFMACAKTCHPGWHDLELNLPVTRDGEPEKDRKWEKVFQTTRKSFPEEAPGDWRISAIPSETEVKLNIVSERNLPDVDDLYFFCEDNLIHSDKPQEARISDDKKQITLTLTKSGFGPDDSDRLSGLLFRPAGWPGSSSKWLRVSVPFSNPR